MSRIDELLKETGDKALDLIKASFKKKLLQAKQEPTDIIKETADKLEKWLIMRKKKEIDDDELVSLIKTRKRVLKQYLLTKEVSSRAKLEKLSIGLIDVITNKFIGAIF